MFSVEKTNGKERVYTHYFYQGLFAEIGNMKGFQTHIPAQDKNKSFTEKKLGEVSTLLKLYEFTFPEILRKVQTIDVVWFNNRKYPNSFYEIEHSTDINNSLLKFVELQDFRATFHIVADVQRKAEFESKISLSAFMSIKPFVKFWDYDLVMNFHTKITESNLAENALP